MRQRQVQEVTNGGDAPASIKCDVRKHFGFLASRLVEVERGQLPLNNEDTATATSADKWHLLQHIETFKA